MWYPRNLLRSNDFIIDNISLFATQKEFTLVLVLYKRGDNALLFFIGAHIETKRLLKRFYFFHSVVWNKTITKKQSWYSTDLFVVEMSFCCFWLRNAFWPMFEKLITHLQSLQLTFSFELERKSLHKSESQVKFYLAFYFWPHLNKITELKKINSNNYQFSTF